MVWRDRRKEGFETLDEATQYCGTLSPGQSLRIVKYDDGKISIVQECDR